LNIRILDYMLVAALASALLSSCAMTFRTQTIRVNCETEDATLKCDDDIIVNNRHKIQKTWSYVLSAEKEGFRRRNVVLIPNTIDAMIIGDLLPIPLGAVIGSAIQVEDGFGRTTYSTGAGAGIGVAVSAYFLYLDLYGTGFRAHKAKVTIPALEPLPDRGELDKYFLVDDAVVDLEEGDVVYNYFLNEKKKKKSRPTFSSGNDEAFKNLNYGLRASMNRSLSDLHFTDTTERFFPNYNNSLLIDCTLDKIEANESGVGSYIDAKVDLKFVVKDYHGVELHAVDIRGISNPFPNSTRADFIINDALLDGFIKLLNDAEVARIIKERDAEIAEITKKEFVELKKPVTPAKGFTELMNSVVTIETEEGHGSGCIVSSDGYVVTNFHVVGKEKKVTVILNDGTKVEGNVERTDPIYDLALISTGKTGLTAMVPQEKVSVALGDEVYAIGTPADPSLGQTVTQGIISAKRTVDDRMYLQTDAKVNPGNSGGALVTKDGKFLGVVSSKVMGLGVEGVGFAIPAHHIYERLKVEYKK